jgi:gluconolactonase
MADGSVLLVEIARGTLSRVTPDGRVQVVADLGGGPNGAAIGPDGAVYVCNNGGFRYVSHRATACGRWRRPTTIQRRPHRAREPGHRQGRAAVRQVDGIALRGPNDLVFDADGGFYFTDLGKVREREMDRGGVFHAMTDGRSAQRRRAPGDDAQRHRAVARRPHAVLRRDRRRAAVGLRHHRPRAGGQARPGRRRTAGAGRGRARRAPTSASTRMAVDALGNILVATLLHGGISVVSPDGSLCSHVPLPDRMYVTNLCFGGPDLRTLYVTLSGTGRLLAIDDWPVPGLKLHFNA